MWHSDTISLALSRCWLHTPAPAGLHVHTDAHARTHTPTMFSPGFSRCSAVCICVTDTGVCVRVYISCVQKCFSAVQWQVQHEEIWLASRSQTHCCFSQHTYTNTKTQTQRHTHTLTHTHTFYQKHIDRPSDECFVLMFAGASITTISKPSLRGPSWETLSSKPCELNAYSWCYSMHIFDKHKCDIMHNTAHSQTQINLKNVYFLQSLLREPHPVCGKIRFPVLTQAAHTVSTRPVETTAAS